MRKKGRTWLEFCNRREGYLSYEDAKRFVHTTGIKNQVEWKEFCRSGKKPSNIPSGPDVFYKGKGWVNYGDWLGTGAVSKKLIQYRSFSEARSFMRKVGITTIAEWRAYCMSGMKPIDIPVSPHAYYRLCGWLSYADFFNANMRRNSRKLALMDFEKARDLSRTLGCNSWDEWDLRAKNKKLPSGLPRFPNIEYASRWMGWKDWLGG